MGQDAELILSLIEQPSSSCMTGLDLRAIRKEGIMSSVESIEQIRSHIDEINARARKLIGSDPASARELAEEAHRLATADGTIYERGLGWSLLTLGDCLHNDGDYVGAREYLVRAVELLE